MGLFALPSVAYAEEVLDDGNVKVEIDLVNTPADGTNWQVGETMKFNLYATNENPAVTGLKIAAAEDTNLTGAYGVCQWRAAAVGKRQVCENRATHVVTMQDVEAGGFTPSVTYSGYPQADYAGTPTKFATATGAEITNVQAAAGEDEDAFFSVVITRSGANASSNEAHVGETVTFDVTVTNLKNQTVTAFPSASNLSGVLTNSSTNCRWANLPANGHFTCKTANYTVKESDLTAGTFTPSITYLPTSDRDGKNALGDAVTATGAELTVLEEVPFHDAAMDVSERVDGEAITLGVAGYLGFECQRIPALTSLTNGWILAAWDGRPNGCGDSPNPNSIVQRISKDGGKSWSEPEVVIQGSETAPIVGYSDPSYVVDRETGHVFLFSVQSYNQGFHGSVPGVDPTDRNVAHAQVSESSDFGVTWSAPRTITADITTGLESTVKSRFAASGEGIQKQYAPNKGRLVQQFTYKTTGNVMQAVSVYSDDHGATWHRGEPFGTGMDENKVVELSNGDLMVNSRASDGVKARKVAISKDGGEHYGEVSVDSTLIDPNNNASIYRAYPNAEQDSALAKLLLFTNAANTGGRSNGTVKLSCDDGASWAAAKVFEPGGMQYSTITALRDENGNPIPGKYGILYEANGPTIKYVQVSMDWLNAVNACVAGVEREVRRGVNLVEFRVTNYGTDALENTKLVGQPQVGIEWQEPETALPTIAPGETVSVKVPVLVTALANAGTMQLKVQMVAGDDVVAGAANVTVVLQGDEQPAKCVAGVELISQLRGQSNAEAPEKMLDGDPNTMWHTPYSSFVELPVNVDFAVPYSAELGAATFTPRASGANGKIKAATLYYVDAEGNEHELDSVSDGATTYSLAKLAELEVPAGTQKVTLRLKVTQTFGDTANKWISLAEACFLEAGSPAPTYDETLVTFTAPFSNVEQGAEDPADCDTTPYVQLDLQENVQYTVKVDDTEVQPSEDGRVDYDYGQTVVVTAAATQGYKLAGDQTKWTWTAPTKESLQCEPADPEKPEGPDEPIVNPDEPDEPIVNPGSGNENASSDVEGKQGSASEPGPTGKQIVPSVQKAADEQAPVKALSNTGFSGALLLALALGLSLTGALLVARKRA